MNQMDEMAKIQKKVVKIEEIRKMHKAAKEKSNQVTILFYFFVDFFNRLKANRLFLITI